MAKTHHFQKRMSQRGIREDLVQFVLRFGSTQHDGRIVLDRRQLRKLLEEIECTKQVALRALQRNGIVVVEKDGALITTYGLEACPGHRK